jgi:exopolyphosphatase/guanosine-5'-triphosphate,3'-diphosphate pyrophosphatase
VIRCHARGPVDAPELLLTRKSNDRAWVSWRPARLPMNPRTLHLLGEEVQAWARSGPLRLELAA